VRRILITGADGFLARHLLKEVSVRAYEIVATVRNRARKLAYEREGYRAFVCDVADAINVGRIIGLSRPDALIHLAGVSHPSEAATDPLAAHQSIVGAWANILDAVRRIAPAARLLMASSCEVYGLAGQDGNPVPESTPAQPISVYGSFKWEAEEVARVFMRHYGLNVIIARPFHYLGSGQPQRFLLAAAARRIAEWDPSGNGDELRLPDLSSRRDLLHVQDVAAAYLKLIENGRPGEVYNICSGHTMTCREAVEALLSECGLQVRLTQAGPADSEGYAPVLCGDSTKLREQVGWQPTHSVQDALREMLAASRVGQTATARWQ